MKRGQMGGQALQAGTAAGNGGGRPAGGPEGHGGRGHGDGPMAAGAEIFSFTIEGDQVTSASRTVNGNVIALPTQADATFTLKGDDIVLTRSFTNAQEVIVFSDADADQLWAIDSRARIHTAAPPTDADGNVRAHQVQVTLDATTGEVTEVAHVLRDGTTAVRQGDDVSYSLSQGLLVETHTHDDGQARWEIYRDGNADGTYTEVAQGFGDVVDLATVLSLTEPNIDLL